MPSFHYEPEFFAPQELVPPQVFADRGIKALHLLNAHVLECADILRKAYGPAFINTWHNDQLTAAYGERQWSGLRTPDSPYYRPYSQHTIGNALDIVFRDTTAEQIRADIESGLITFPYNVVIERGVSWLHIATANYGSAITWIDP